MSSINLALLGGSKLRTQPFAKHPEIGAVEKKEVADVLRSGLLSGFIARAGESFLGGPKVRALEELFKEFFDVPFAMTVNSATSGLHAALAACGVGPGDEVIVPPYTMSASASAVLMCGAVPRFADISEDIYCLDPEAVRQSITKRTKAIVVVHLFGHPARMNELMALARKHRIKVVEDCAQSPGAIYHGKYTGVIGDAGVFSLNQHKTITTGEGGVVVTRSEDIAVKVRLVRNHGEAVVEQMPVKDISNTLGWNYRMTELDAAVGIGQFMKLKKLTAYRQDLAGELNAQLKSYKGLVLPVTLPGCSHAYFLYSIRYDEKVFGIPRALFIQALQAEGIPMGMGYVKPLYLSPVYQQQICFGKSGWPFTSIPKKDRPKYQKGLCPVTEHLHEKSLIHTNICYYPVKRSDLKDFGRAFEKILSSKQPLLNWAQKNNK